MRARQLLLQTPSNSVTSITGTANQVIASAGVGAITLSTPQDIGTASSPSFKAMTLTATRAELSGSTQELLGSSTFQDGGTTSTTFAAQIRLTPTINYTAASKTGKVNMIYLAPTLTSQPSGNNSGITFSSAFNSTTFPAITFNNVADEDTNYEKVIMQYNTNNFLINSTKGGSGTSRSIALAFTGTIKFLVQSGRMFIASAVAIAWDNADSFGTVPIQMVNTAQNGMQGLTYTISGTLTGSPTDWNAYTFATAQAGAFTTTRLNVFNVQNVTGAATVTDMPLFRFDANAGTHKSVNSGTTKTTPGTVTQWIVINVNGTLGYIPTYSSKTS